jgi:hypothetical protein
VTRRKVAEANKGGGGLPNPGRRAPDVLFRFRWVRVGECGCWVSGGAGVGWMDNDHDVVVDQTIHTVRTPLNDIQQPFPRSITDERNTSQS